MILMQDSPSTYFYVQVIVYELGAYEHHRGRKVFGFELDLSFLTPSTSHEYQDMMKNYFAAGKKLRDKSIQKIYGNNK